jgi:hypothetical protein
MRYLKPNHNEAVRAKVEATFAAELVITARGRRDAEKRVTRRTLTCDFCRAEVPASVGTVEAEAA